MKSTYKIIIETSITFDNWDEMPKKLTKKEVIEKAKNFIQQYYPMTQTTLGNNSGELVIKLKTIK